MRRVFVTTSQPESALSRLRERAEVAIFTGRAGPDAASPVDGPTRAELIRGASGAFGILCCGRDVIDAAVLDATGVRVVATVGEAIDHIDLDAARARRVWVTNTPGLTADAVADHAMALILGLTREVVAADRWVRAGGGAFPRLGTELRTRTLGIIGLGRVGRAVARRARAFGMRILYCGGSADGVTAEARDLDPLLRESDVVSIHCALSPATRGLIGARELGLMARTSWLVNTAHGAIVDGEALVGALAGHRIAGAALDVHGSGSGVERPDPRLFGLDNVILTPRLGAATVDARLAMAERAVDNLVTALSGGRPPDLLA